MPTIFILDSIKILVFFEDHNPPHFHAIYNEYEELILIPSGESLRGSIPAEQKRKLVEWLALNTNSIVQKWNEFNPDSKI
ncbi:MAG: DUF4160 domain-containing protein [Saprospiraceae bacterium]|nr:DUF4160 domain-containing protein [Saprospiraceae bacterium]